jgi:Tol biopolymer transport system component
VHHCPRCGKPLPRKNISPAPFYLIGFTLLALSGLWLGRYLNFQPLSFLPTTIGLPRETMEIPAEDLPTVDNTHTPAVLTSTPIPPTSVPPTPEPPTPIVPSENPIGKIVFTCQIFKDNNRNQLCMINADGSNERRLTTNDFSNHYYASFSPDGQSIVFSSNQAGGDNIFEMDLDGHQTQLTSIGNSYAPEISPDRGHIVFSNSGGAFTSIWIMDRDGSNPREIFSPSGVGAFDPTWSPDGEKILFALGVGDGKKLHTINPDGSNLQVVSEEFTTRGRSDWSPKGDKIAGYSGGEWQRKVYLMNFDGSGLLQLFGQGNVQAPSFSPDSGWVAFTGYIDKMHNSNGCEIYILRLKDNELNRLTDNDYCDWQPRWGP